MRSLLLLFLLTAPVALRAQQDTSGRRVYLHTDRSAYVSGDTVWFKAYVRSGPVPDLQTRNIWIELLDGRGRVLGSMRRPLFAGMGIGDFPLPPSLAQGVYVVRTVLPALPGGTAEVAYQFLAVAHPSAATPEWGALLSGRPTAQPGSIRLTGTDKGKVFYLDTEAQPAAAWIQGVQYDNPVFRQAVKKGSTQAGRIPLDQLASGRLDLQLLTEDGSVLEEVSGMVQKADERVVVHMQADTLEARPGGRTALRFTFPDSLEGSFSLSVTDADAEFSLPVRPNILSGLLTGHAGAIPADGFHASRSMDAQLLPRPAPVPFSAPRDEPYISVSGQITGRKKKKQWPEISFLVQYRDSTQELFSVPVADDGRFRLENLIAEDTTLLYYQADKLGLAELRLDSPAVWKGPATLPPNLYTAIDPAFFSDPVVQTRTKGTWNNLQAAAARGQKMEEIIVRTRALSPTAQLNKRYTTGAFSNMSMVKVYDFINNPPCPPYGNIFDCLQGKVAGLTITRQNGLQYILRSSRAVSLTGGQIPVKVFLDEVMQPDDQTDQAATVPLSQIALVKYFLPGYFPLATGIAPVLAIYTKRAEDLGASWGSRVHGFRWMGYTPVRAFQPEGLGSGKTTIYWQPELGIDWGKELRVSFSNPSGARRLRVVLEGITREGRLVHLDQVVE